MQERTPQRQPPLADGGLRLDLRSELGVQVGIDIRDGRLR